MTKIKPPPRTSDRAIYWGIVIVGFFFVMLASLLTEMHYWTVFVMGYAALIAYLINIYTYHIYRGKHLANWQGALARIPLRFAGYGTKHGKPLDAAHDHPEVLRVLLISVALSAALLTVLALLTWRSLQ